jgi:L-lactate dehydrogenase complex protein LldF
MYGIASRIGVRVLRMMGGRRRMIRRLPLGHGWTEGRDMPAPAGRTFRELHARRAHRAGAGEANR